MSLQCSCNWFEENDMTDIIPGNNPSTHAPNTRPRNAALFGIGAVLLGIGLAAGLIMHKVAESDSVPMSQASQTAYQAETDQQKYQDQLKQQGAVNERSAAVTTREEPRARATQHAAPSSSRRTSSSDVYNDMPPTASGVCTTCGVVESVKAVQVEGQGSGVGAVTGGVLGGVVGNQMGKGSGNAAMTVLGAIGGGIAGNEIEKSRHRSTVYQVTVRMDDGSTRIFNRKEPTAAGTRVDVSGSGFTERGSVN
jgi:outer membrane lipoprotein SlyB